MDTKAILRDYQLALYVKDIFVMESKEEKTHVLPFFADGYPSMMFHEDQQGAYRQPVTKKLSEFFLYGHTLLPIEITIEGPYRIIVFQLHPFAAKTLLGVNPRELNDECFDLSPLTGMLWLHQLYTISETEARLQQIAAFIASLIQEKTSAQEQKIRMAIHLILNSKGQITVRELREHLQLNERTLQRQFLDYVGISPKQFAKIIQFQGSFEQLSEDAYGKLSEIVYDNGYADQSHFIRSFRKYTGKKPSEFF